MNDCLGLPLLQGADGVRSLAGWEALWMPLGEGEAERLPAGRGEGWQPVEVPAQQAAVLGRQSLWYRTGFTRPDHAGRLLLRIGGAFLAANVWLNGRLLGAHYGYFAPFGFDITPFLRDDNLLVICCESPVETDLARKRHVMGIFNDGDSRPYPSSAYFSLPEEFKWEVPLGLWRPVQVEYVGAVTVDWMRCKPRLEAGDVGRLEVEARLRNLDGRDMTGEVELEVAAADGSAGPLRLRREFRIAGGLERTLSMLMSLPGVRRWSPWRLGPADLYRASLTVLVEGRESARVSDSFGFRDLLMTAGPEGWTVRANGQPFFLRGANYTPAFRLDTLTSDRFRQDLRLAHEANLDALRVHAHVLPEEFYRCADEAGMIVLADFPLTAAYGYHATGDEARFFETSVREQVPEMVELLGNRPSIAAWVTHDDPPWIAANRELADVHAVRQNHSIDEEAKALFDRLDGTRLALAASGQYDAHLYHGWKEGGWEAFADADPAMVTEFGAQALPSAGSPAWNALGGRRWPVRDDDPRWVYGGFQVPCWAENGVGLPSQHPTLDEYIEASQEYQAWVIRFAVEQFRKRKFEHCWGAFAYQLVDAFPGIGFGVLDSDRVPRPAYAALRDAMAPLRLMVEPIGFVPIEPFGIGYLPSGPVAMRIIVVNDDAGVSGPAVVRWGVRRERLGTATAVDRLRDVVRRKSFGGSVDLELPAATEPALQVASVSLGAQSEGDYVVEAELHTKGRLAAAAELRFSIARAHRTPRTRPRMPAYLAERLVQAGSIEPQPSGFSLRLLNRTRPAVLTAARDVRVDGALLRRADVLLETGSGRLPLGRPLELPLNRPLTLYVETGESLGRGEHEVEIDLTVEGVASGRVTLRGHVDSGERGAAG